MKIPYIITAIIILIATIMQYSKYSGVKSLSADINNKEAKLSATNKELKEAIRAKNVLNTTLQAIEGKLGSSTAMTASSKEKRESAEFIVERLLKEKNSLDVSVAQFKKIESALMQAIETLKDLGSDPSKAIYKLEKEVAINAAKIKSKQSSIVKMKSFIESQKQSIAQQKKLLNADIKIAKKNLLQGRVAAVNKNWGFALIFVNNKNNVVQEKDTFSVSRNGQHIGMLKATSKSFGNYIVANVDIDSPIKGSINPGDQILYIAAE